MKKGFNWGYVSFAHCLLYFYMKLISLVSIHASEIKPLPSVAGGQLVRTLKAGFHVIRLKFSADIMTFHL